MGPREKRNKALGERVVKALESRNMEAYYAESKEEAVKTALRLINEGSTINMGGSTSVRESGLIDFMTVIWRLPRRNGIRSHERRLSATGIWAASMR